MASFLEFLLKEISNKLYPRVTPFITTHVMLVCCIRILNQKQVPGINQEQCHLHVGTV